jgi:hypothetical protein
MEGTILGKTGFNIEYMHSKFSDPLRFNTFGNLLEGDGVALENGTLKGAGKEFDIRIHALTMQGEQYEGWYHDYYFTSGLEITTMMIDYVNYTGDQVFCNKILAPFAREVLLFFDKHYPRDEKGKLRLEPAQVLETWWISVNPSPDIAGLRYNLRALLDMKVGTAADREQWTRLYNETPEIPLQTIDEKIAIAPAEKWKESRNRNSENGNSILYFHSTVSVLHLELLIL